MAQKYILRVDKDVNFSESILDKLNLGMRINFNVDIIRDLQDKDFRVFRDKFLKLLYGLCKKI